MAEFFDSGLIIQVFRIFPRKPGQRPIKQHKPCKINMLCAGQSPATDWWVHTMTQVVGKVHTQPDGGEG